jgi:RNA polymerase sigma factor (sigma-70 family)
VSSLDEHAERRPARAAVRGGRATRRAAREEIAGLYEEQVWSVYGFFGYRVSSAADAEDLTQLTFERALRAWGRFDPERASARTWLMSIASNLLIDHYRRDRSTEQEPIEDHLSRRELSSEDPDLGLAPDLADALEQLGQRERELIALRFGGELNGPEIAELTGLSLANVQQILSRSLRKVRAQLEEVAELAGSQGGEAVQPDRHHREQGKA